MPFKGHWPPSFQKTRLALWTPTNTPKNLCQLIKFFPSLAWSNEPKVRFGDRNDDKLWKCQAPLNTFKYEKPENNRGFRKGIFRCSWGLRNEPGLCKSLALQGEHLSVSLSLRKMYPITTHLFASTYCDLRGTKLQYNKLSVNNWNNTYLKRTVNEQTKIQINARFDFNTLVNWKTVVLYYWAQYFQSIAPWFGWPPANPSWISLARPFRNFPAKGLQPINKKNNPKTYCEIPFMWGKEKKTRRNVAWHIHIQSKEKHIIAICQVPGA